MTLFGRTISLLAAVIVVLAVAPGGAQQAAPPNASGQPPPASLAETERRQKPALLNQYCITCHNQRLKTGGLMLDTLDLEHVGKDAAAWEKVVRKVRTGMMPPSGARRPERALLDSFASDLEGRLDKAVTAGANLDAPALH